MAAGGQQQVYHRLENPISQSQQIAAQQVATGELWGRPIRGGGLIPSVKAYPGPLPSGSNGIEFTTNIPATHLTPSTHYWVHGFDPGITLRQVGGDTFAIIPVLTISKVP